MDLKEMRKTFVIMEQSNGYTLQMQDYDTDYRNCSMFLLITPNERVISVIERRPLIEYELNGRTLQKFGNLNVSIQSIKQKLKL